MEAEKEGPCLWEGGEVSRGLNECEKLLIMALHNIQRLSRSKC